MKKIFASFLHERDATALPPSPYTLDHENIM